MERFELVRNEEERKEKYQKLVDYILSHGINEEWKLKDLLKEIIKESDFGLENNIPVLTDYDQKKVDKLFSEREELILKYKEISDYLKSSLLEEDTIWNKMQETNREICQIEGHRLSEESYQNSTLDEYDRPTKSFGVWYRKCLVCGKEISQGMINYRDCVVKGEEGPKRILYNYKDK